MDPEEEDGYYKGSWCLTGLKLKKETNKKKQSLVAISTQGPLTQTQGEACTELPAGTVFLPSEPALIEECLESYFNP